MLILENPYEGLWEKHLSVDDMDMILESRMGGTYYGLSVLSANNGKSISATTNTAISRQTIQRQTELKFTENSFNPMEEAGFLFTDS